MAAPLAIGAPSSHAYSQAYCGYLIPSTTSGYSCYSNYAAGLTFNLAHYPGSGVITFLTAGLRGYEGSTYSGVTASLCFTWRSGTVRGGLAQNDGGARHTINGSVDDSLNHTGCIS